MGLVADHRFHQFLDRVGADGGAVAGLDRRLLHLAADLGEHLQRLADAVLHGVDGGGGLGKAEHAGERGRQRREHGLVGGEEADRLLIETLFGVGGLQQPRHHHLGGVVGDGEVVGQILGDLIALLDVLQVADALVAGQFQARALAASSPLKASTDLHRLVDLGTGRVELALGLLQYLSAKTSDCFMAPRKS